MQSLRVALVSSVVTAILFGLLGAANQEGQAHFITNGVTVRDEQNRVRILLSASSMDGPAIAFFDENGASRLLIGVAPSGIGGGNIILSDKYKRRRMRIGLTETGDAAVKMWTPGGAVTWVAPTR